jgi:hypothetical protein
VSLIAAFYRLLIHLYPRPFREEFGAEMEIVFQEQMAEAASHGHIILLSVCWRELRDWPFHCFRAHWQVRQQRLNELSGEPPSWWETAITGFPYFLFALFASGSILIFLFGQSAGLLITLLFGYGFGFVFFLVLIIAWWRGWPVWSAAWLGFLFFILLVLFLPSQLVNLFGQSSLTQPALMIVTEVGFPLLWLAVLYVLLARWPRVGLVAMLPTLGMAWIMYLEFVPEGVQAAVIATTWIWLGIVAIVFLRWRHHDWDVWLLYLAATVVGMIYVYTGHFLTEMQVRDGTLARMGEDLLSDLLPVLTPLVAILLLDTLRLWSRVNGRTAVTSYRFLLVGFWLTLIGAQTSQRLARQGDVGNWFTAVLLIGCLLMAAGAWSIVKGRRQWQLPVRRPLWLLLSLLLLLPLVLEVRWLPDIYNQIKYQQLGIEEFIQQQIESRVLLLRQLSTFVGVIWLLLAGWVIGHLRLQLPPIQSQKAKRPDAVMAVPSAVPPVQRRNGGMKRRDRYFIFAGLILLAGLLLRPTTLGILFPTDSVQPFDWGTSFPLFLVMTMALIMAAILLSSGLRLIGAGQQNAAICFFIFSALLLGAAMLNFYWLIVWDDTYDGLGYLWLFIPVLGVFFATVWLVFTLPKRAKLAAFLYLLLLPPSLILISGRAQQVDFRQLTEARAERVNQAIEVYYRREGHYPEELGQLTPRYLFSLSEPVIIFGQDWCYSGGGDDYQFGYVYREHWSNPNLAGLVRGAGDGGASDLSPICEKEIAALQARDPQYYGLRNE